VLEYIGSEKKNDDLIKLYENENGELVTKDEILENWEQDKSDRKNGNDFYHLILSTKENKKDEKLVREAVRETLNQQFGGNYKYTMIAHTDTNNLHYHIVINTKSIVNESRLSIDRVILQNTRATFGRELEKRDFNYKAEQNLTQREITILNEKTKNFNNENIYKYKIKKIKSLKPNEIIEEYKKLELKNDELLEEYKKKNIKYNEFKKESSKLFTEKRLITSAVNSNFYNISLLITNLNERKDKLEKNNFISPFNKEKIILKKKYSELIENTFKNFHLKEELYNINANKSLKNLEFDIKKNNEIKEVFKTIDKKYLSTEIKEKLESFIKNDLSDKKIEHKQLEIVNSTENKKNNTIIKKTTKGKEYDKKINDHSNGIS
jgi:hypothetical protein